MAKDEEINKNPEETSPEAPEATSSAEAPEDTALEGELVQDGIEKRGTHSSTQPPILRTVLCIDLIMTVLVTTDFIPRPK